MIQRAKIVPILMGGGLASEVRNYATRSGMEAAKMSQLNDLVAYLKQQGLWDNIRHLYLTIKGFNADSEATIYDVVAGGENLAQTGCTWPTDEGQALSVPAAANIISTNALVPTTGSNTVIVGTRFLKFTAAISGYIWVQYLNPVAYGVVFNYNATPTSTNFWANAGDGTIRFLNNSYRINQWTQTFLNQAYWKSHPIALVLNSATGRLFAYINRDSCSAIATGLGNDDGVAVAAPVVPDAPFQLSQLDRFDFDLEYILIMDIAITGTQYQNITYQIERALAPRNPVNVNPGLLEIDASGNDIASASTSIYYDSITEKYYRYACWGVTYTGTPPKEAGRGTYNGVYCYSSSSMAGPWTSEGLAYDINNSTLLTALNSDVADSWIYTPTVIYHTTRAKYVMGMKAGPHRIFVLAESDNPQGPFITTYAGHDSVVDPADCCIFRDTDGTAYVVYHNATDLKLQICALNANYTAPTGSPADITTSNYEAPGMVKVGDRYWVIASGSNVWTPTDHKAFYSDAATPMSGWNDIGSPFDSGDDAYTQSFHSQSLCGLFISKGGDVIYNGTRNVPMWYAPFDRRETAMRHIMLPVAISGETMTISWDAHWSPADYE